MKKIWVHQAHSFNEVKQFEMEYYRSLESVGGKARVLGHYEIITGDYKNGIHLIKQYRDIERADVQRVARKYLEATNRTMVVALPKRKR